MRNIIGTLYANHEQFNWLLEYFEDNAKGWPVFQGMEVSVSITGMNTHGIKVEIYGEGESGIHMTNYTFTWASIVDGN